MIKLGSLVRDNITGFSGIAVARTYHLHGCIHISIQPTKPRNGRISRYDSLDSHYESLDEQRVEVTGVHSAFTDHEDAQINPMLGYKVQHKISGYTGVVGAYRQKLVGADEVMIEADHLDEDGNIGPSYWTPVNGVVVLEAKAPPVSADTSVGNPGFNSRAL